MKEGLSFVRKIENKDSKEHVEGVENELSRIQISFFDKKYQQYKKEYKEKKGEEVEESLSDFLIKNNAYYAKDAIVLAENFDEDSKGEGNKHLIYIDELYDQLPEFDLDNASIDAFKDRAENLKVISDYMEEQKKISTIKKSSIMERYV